MNINQAVEAQLKNIQIKTGRSLNQLAVIVQKSGFREHNDIRDMFHREMGLPYAEASTLTQAVLHVDGTRAASGDPMLDTIYTGLKVGLRPIHEKLMDNIMKFGEFEVLPKFGYVSLRRKRQFAMLGPANSTRFELGLNGRGLTNGSRLLQQLPGGMCDYKIKLRDAAEVDGEVLGWVWQAYNNAG